MKTETAIKQRNMYAEMFICARQDANHFSIERDMKGIKLKLRDMVINRLNDDLRAAKRKEWTATVCCCIVFCFFLVTLAIVSQLV